MNLAEPTIGDILDRLSILSMRAPTSEGTVLSEVLNSKLPATMDRGQITLLLVQAVALGAINGRLWELHEHPGDLPLTYAMALNKLRREMSAEIDV